jgi:CheY-like chemotaxis protein
VESAAGHGSIFRIVTPLPRCEPVAPQDRAEPECVPMAIRILAAEDNMTNQHVLAALLAPLEVEIAFANHGQEAVELFRAQAFDVVLMDAQMPVMNGIDATRAIRAWEAERGRARTPILALTANVMRHQMDEYLDAGMDGVVAKPVEAMALFAALERALASSETLDARAA